MKSRGLAVLLAMVFLGACAAGAPDISLSQVQADLGKVTNGEVRSLVIGLSNTGKRDLVIESVTTSCGCTSASVEPGVIPPGGAGNLTIHYDSGAHGPEFSGEVTRQVFVDTSDPDESEVVFTFTVTVVSP